MLIMMHNVYRSNLRVPSIVNQKYIEFNHSMSVGMNYFISLHSKLDLPIFTEMLKETPEHEMEKLPWSLMRLLQKSEKQL